MKHNKLVSTRTVEKVEQAVKQGPPLNEEAPIYGVKENSRWAKRLKQYNPEAYARLRNWD